jgi:hypothetical protein
MASNSEETKAKPTNDAYTGMLAISLAALLVGSAVLYLDFSQYPAAAPPKVVYVPSDRSPPDWTEKQREAKAPDDNPPDAPPDNAKDQQGKKDG